MQDLVSIIIPCYNASKTISRTIFSVVEQDYENLEVIIVNDGSVDNYEPQEEYEILNLEKTHKKMKAKLKGLK